MQLKHVRIQLASIPSGCTSLSPLNRAFFTITSRWGWNFGRWEVRRLRRARTYPVPSIPWWSCTSKPHIVYLGCRICLFVRCAGCWVCILASYTSLATACSDKCWDGAFMSSLIRLVDVMKRWSLDGVETLKGFPWAYPMSDSLVNVCICPLAGLLLDYMHDRWARVLRRDTKRREYVGPRMKLPIFPWFSKVSNPNHRISQTDRSDLAKLRHKQDCN